MLSIYNAYLKNQFVENNTFIDVLLIVQKSPYAYDITLLAGDLPPPPF